ncbi:MAG: sigma 54-interacting transcriptional regulator [Bdellovibrionales bacterium]|nr:sigma 54-interacting transcriptional regulator [Bdellovibrionales bacterium]
MNDNFFSVIILSFFFLIATPAKSFGGDCAGLLYPSEANIKIQKVVRALQLLNTANMHPSLLITGPSGTGKSALAREIHKQLGLKGPFVEAPSCATNGDLGLASLVGVVKGAFTGATVNRSGAIASANGGVLFVDDIDTLPTIVQEALLTFLQTRCYYPLGSTTANCADDVVIIFATNADLDVLVRERSMRADFLARMRSSVQISIPPLTARLNEIPALAEFFLGQLNNRFNAKITATQDALEQLKLHSWSGNIRELEATIQAAFLSAIIEGRDVITNIPVGTRQAVILNSNSDIIPPNVVDGWEWNSVPAAPNKARDSLRASLEQIKAAQTEATSSQNKNSSTIKDRKKIFNVQLRAFFEKTKEIYVSMGLQLEVDRFIASFITASIDLEISLQPDMSNPNVETTKIIDRVLFKMGLASLNKNKQMVNTPLLALAAKSIRPNSSTPSEGQSLNLFDDEVLSSLANKNFEALYALMKELGITFKEVTLDEFRTTLNSSP